MACASGGETQSLPRQARITKGQASMKRFQPSGRPGAEDAILLVVSKGLPDFVRNALLSIARAAVVDCDICLAVPENALPELQSASAGFDDVIHVPLEEVCARDYSAMMQYQIYGNAAFARFTVSKWIAIRALLSAGYQRVTFADADVAWIRDPLPLLRRVLQTFEVAIQTEGTEHFPPAFCTGFMSWRRSEFTLRLLEQLERYHVATVETESTAHDQIVFNRLVAGSPKLTQRIFGLSELLFANGLVAGALAARDAELDQIMAGRIAPLIFHANWTVGLERKRQLLQRTGNWLIEG
jgi:hypothetical protein